MPALGAMATGMFAASLGIERLFNAGTQDCSNKFAVSEILYGSAEIHPIADIDQADHLLLIGTNPRISKMSFLSTPDPVGVLRAARARAVPARGRARSSRLATERRQRARSARSQQRAASS